MKEGSRIKTKPDIPWKEDAPGEVPENEAGSGSHHGPNGTRLTMLTISEILAYEDDPRDILLSNGYIEKGAPFVICGPPGIGKSRLALQLAIKSVLGQGFLGWETQAGDIKWALLQNENGQRRLKADLRVMVQDMTTKEREILDKNILIHSIVTDVDGHLDLSDPEARKRVKEVVQDYQPGVVIGDPLTAFGVGDWNSDRDMLLTARDFGRIVRDGDPKRVPGLLHHARTGSTGAQTATGFERGSFARNSKALYGWTRAQFNVTPYNENNNDTLVFASGKCNNAREFEEFTIELDTATMTYSRTNGDIAGWKERVKDSGKSSRFKNKYHRRQILEAMNSYTARQRKDILKETIDKTGMSERTFDGLWKQLKTFEEITESQEGKWTRL